MFRISALRTACKSHEQQQQQQQAKQAGGPSQPIAGTMYVPGAGSLGVHAGFREQTIGSMRRGNISIGAPQPPVSLACQAGDIVIRQNLGSVSPCCPYMPPASRVPSATL